MARDVNLSFIAGSTAMAGVGAKGSEVDCEGGSYALARMFLGTCSGTTVVCDVQIQASIDGGSNWFHIGQFPKLDESDSDVEIARPVYIPKPTLASSIVTKVRLYTRTSSGSSPVVGCDSAHLEPLVSLAAPATDMELVQVIGCTPSCISAPAIVTVAVAIVLQVPSVTL